MPEKKTGVVNRTLADVFDRVLDDSQAALYIFQGGGFKYFNQRFIKLFGYSEQELEHMGPIDLTHPDDHQRVREQLRLREEGHQEYSHYTVKVRRKDGLSFYAEVRGHLVIYNGKPAIAGILLDVDAEKRLEVALRESEQNYRTLLEHTSDGIAVVVRDEIVFANESFARIFGFDKAADLIGTCVEERVHPSDLDRYRRIKVDISKGAVEAIHVEGRGVTRAGRVIQIEIRAKLIAHAGKRALFASVRDVTSTRRKLQEFKAISEVGQALNRSKNLQQLLSIIHEQVSALMPAANFYVALLDERQKMVSFPYFVDEEDPPPAPRSARRGLTEYVIRSGRSLVWTRELADELEATGELEVIGTRPASWLGAPLQHYDRTVGAIVVQSYSQQGAYSDADREVLEAIASTAAFAIERQVSADALAAAAARYRALFEANHDAIIILSNGVAIDCNGRAPALFGCSRDDLIGSTPMSLSPPAQPDGARSIDRAAELVAAAEAGESATFSWQLTRAGQAPFDAEITLSPVQVAGERCLQMIVRDVTDHLRAVREQDRLREQLAQVQKMEAIGTLAGGIAHDFNNLLGGIIGYTSLVKMQMDEKHPLFRAIDTIEKSATRAAELTKQLLGFARGGRYQVVPTDLNQVAGRVLTIINRTFDRSIEIQSSLDSALHAVEGDAGQLEHSLLNLCLNARDAMPAGGCMRIETRNRRLSETDADRPYGAAAGEYVMLSVTDTGIGIDPETQKRIFEPFFTTKERGKGTGMGLAMVYGIVKNHGGAVTVSSEVGRGSTFSLFFPATKRSVELLQERPEVELERGSGTILVVDDEEVVRDMGSSLLVELGYQVLLATNGAEACDIYAANKVDAVLLDVVMPGLSGRDTFHRLRQIDPTARVLVTSGYSIEGQPRELMNAGARGFIQKPYTLHELAVALKEALGPEA